MTWETVRLGAIAQVVGGATPKTSEPAYWDGDIPWVTPAEISRLSGHYIESTERTISSDGLSRSGVQILPTGSVLLSSRAPIGLVAINRIPVGTNQGFKSLIPSDRIESNFLFWWLKSHTKLLQSKGRGATFLELSKAEVERIEIPLPPLPEQRRIAAILDEADALRVASRERFGRANAAADMAVDELVRAAPIVRPLSELVGEKFRNGISPSKTGRITADVLTLSAITRGRFDDTERKTDTFASEHAVDKLVRAGLHLICRGNGNPDLVGKMSVVTKDLENVAFPDTMIAMRPSREISSAALAAAWRTGAVRDQIKRVARTTNGTYKINQQGLGAIRVPVGSPDQQRQVGLIEELRESNTMVHGAALALADALFASLQHRAFRGEL